ncbi:hypothetical protein [Flavobacterium sp.]|uniref:hypothetical protein n=1 Tax=Flavobacterium sp. TaxID=239 RepID=UPI003BD60D71
MDKESDGSPYVRLQVAITDPVAAQKISDKRYLTGSVGGRAEKAVCSITGEDLAAESSDGRPKLAKYKRGQIYKGKLAFIDMQNISFKEYSFVNQPADQRSSVRVSKAFDGTAAIVDSDNWTAKNTAFILHMDKEEITTVQENESIFKNMKKKESRPLYLHLKGSFLTALAFQESETAKADNAALLSEENIIDKENLSMDETIQSEDVLATVENLSQDLSAIATAPKAEPEEISSQEEASVNVESKNVDLISALSAALQAAQEANEQSVIDVLTLKIEDLKKTQEDSSLVEAPAAENAEQSPDEEIKSEGEKVEAEEQVKQEVVDSTNTEISAETEEQEESKVELTDKIKADEQDADDDKLHVLQEENAKLKKALHRTLVERVVDTKISLGTEPIESREELIIDHTKRSAGSLADSLKDLAKLPIAKKNIQKLNESIIENDIVLEEENNVILEDEEVEATPQSKVDIVEELFVDAFMGRRKL